MRGAGWAPDLFLRYSRQRMAQELAYVRHMNLNAIRLEGKMPPDDFFDMADEHGLLVLPCERPQKHSVVIFRSCPLDLLSSRGGIPSRLGRL